MNSSQRIALCSDFLSFTRYVSERGGRKFFVNWHHRVITDTLMKVVRGEIKRLIINIPPRYSKSELTVVNFIPWCLGLYPDSEFIYISYSKRVAAKHAYLARAVVKSEGYCELFGDVALMDDSKAKDEWRTRQGGIVYATGSEGTITGYGAGKMREGFGGCFDYDTPVSTEIGFIKIGDIVTKKINVQVHSYNIETNEVELQPIRTVFTNPPNRIIEVHLSDGFSFRCTPNHKIFTTQGWVEAQYLTSNHALPFHFSCVLDLKKRNAQLLHYFGSGFSSIKHNIKEFFAMFMPVVPIWRFSKILCNRRPCFASFNLSNYTSTNTVFFSNFFCRFLTVKNFNHLLTGKFCAWSFFKQWKSSVFDSILHIVRFRTVSEICKAVVSANSIKVSALFASFSWTYKCFKNQLMNVLTGYFSTNAKLNSMVSVAIKTIFKDSFGQQIMRPFPHYGSRYAFYSTVITNFIRTLKFRDRFPVFVCEIGHVDTTYCLEVRSNNNFYVHEGKVLVSNCIIFDDPHKAGEAESTIQRENVIEFYQSTVESRCNSPHTPIIVIMQRLHHQDLAGFLIDGGSGDKWHHLKIPAISEDGKALWDFKHTIDELLKMKAANPYNFIGQYQQEPTPKEGGIIKSEWFERYRTPPAEKLRIIQSWDTAYKPKLQNDPSVCTTWLQTKDNKYYLLDCFVMRGEYPDVKRAVQSRYDQFKPQAVLIEDKASGQSLIQELRHTRIPVIAIQPENDKITRLNSVSTIFEAKQVYLPENASWLADYEHELLSFPLAAHDDQVDSTSQALEWLRSKSTNALPIVGSPRTF